MKKITLLLFLLTSFIYSQELVTNGDFESGATGWSGNAANVVTESGNSYNSANVATAGDAFAVNLSYVLNITAGTTYKLTFDAWSDGSRTMLAGIGLNESPWRNVIETVTLSTMSQNFTYTFVGPATNTNSRIIFDMGADTGFVGIDNVSLMAVAATCSDGVKNGDETGVDCGGSTCSACPPSGPTTAAPTPPARTAADVISLYSDAYTDVASNLDAGWCGASSIEEVMIAGNATLAWKSNTCQGIVLDTGVDATTFTHLHVDIYIQAGTDLTSKVFNLKFVQQPGGAALEINLNAASTPALVAGSWLSVDVPVDLSTFTGFKEFGVTSGNLNNIAWYDNLYVHKNTTLSTEEFATANFKVFPNPTNGDWNISSNSVLNSVALYDILGKQVIALTPNLSEVSINASSLKSGIYFAKINSDLGAKTIKLIKN